MKYVLLSLVVCCFLCIGKDAHAQHDPAAAQPPCLPVAESPLALLEGAWTVDWTYRTAPGQFAQLQAQALIQQDLHGCALIEHFEGTLRGLPFSAITMFSQTAEGQFDRVRIDSEHGGFTQSEGYMESDSLIFERHRRLETRVLRTRHLFFAMTSTSFMVEFYLSRSADAPWELVQRAQYRKQEEGE